MLLVTDAAKKLLEGALGLPPEERRRLGLALLESVAEGDDDIVLHEAWKDEILRRIERVRSGESKPIPWDEAEARLRESLRKV
jgi:putative addiction module component (TIGR02574 family)